MKHEILVEYETAQAADQTQLLEQAVTAALEAENVTVPCEVSILITDDAAIHAINLEQRDVDRPTDVLSFPMFEYTPGQPPQDSADADPATGRIPLGDVVISMERVREQAREYGHSPERELGYLAVHSVLHLLGYDHLDEGPEKARMREREEVIMSKLGLPRER